MPVFLQSAKGMESFLIQSQLQWPGYVNRIGDNRMAQVQRHCRRAKFKLLGYHLRPLEQMSPGAESMLSQCNLKHLNLTPRAFKGGKSKD